jgi:hypothetical protein
VNKKTRFNIVSSKIEAGLFLSILTEPESNGLQGFHFGAIDIKDQKTLLLKSTESIDQKFDYSSTEFAFSGDSLIIYSSASGKLHLIIHDSLQNYKRKFIPQFCTSLYYFNGDLFQSEGIYGSYVQNVKDTSRHFYTSTSLTPNDYRFSSHSLPLSNDWNVISGVVKPGIITCFGIDANLKQQWSVDMPFTNVTDPFFSILKKGHADYIFLNNSIYCIQEQTGKINWQKVMNGLIRDVIIDENAVYFKLSDSSNTVHLTALSLSDGSIQWQHPFEKNKETFSYPFIRSKSGLLYFTSTGIEVVNSASGKTMDSYNYNSSSKDYYCTVIMDAITGRYYYLKENSLYYNGQ